MGMLDTTELMEALGYDRFDEDPEVQGVLDALRDDDSIDVPIELTDLETWSNYMNDEIYEMDMKVREFLKKTRYQRQAKGGYRTTAPIVFTWMFGRAPEPKDGPTFRLLHKLLVYYCTRYTGATTYKGKPVNRVYYFSKFSANSKRPYSLRLRMEEAKNVEGVFREGPGSKVNKRTRGRRADRGDG